MLSLVELQRAARVLDARLRGQRLQAVVQLDDHSVALETYGSGAGRSYLRLSCRPQCARVSLFESRPPAPSAPGAFGLLLRARLSGARLGGVTAADDDRRLELRIRTRDGDCDLLLEILGARANVYLLDASARVVGALRSLGARSELAIGGPWSPPESRPRSAGEDRFAQESDDRFLFVIEALYADRERREELAALARGLGKVLRREQKSLDRKLARLADELEAARAATGLKRRGELLKGVLGAVRRGEEQVLALDHETGEEVAIPLDPAKTPAQNLEDVFRRYRKAVRAVTRVGAQLEGVRAARDELAALGEEFGALETAGGAEGASALRAFAERADVRRLLAKRAPRPAPVPRRARGKRELPSRLRPRRYRSAGELEIWVGRSDQGNDHLTTRLARGKDLFFHLEAI